MALGPEAVKSNVDYIAKHKNLPKKLWSFEGGQLRKKSSHNLYTDKNPCISLSDSTAFCTECAR